MPVTPRSIPKQNDLMHWAYLSKVTIPSISSKVELLFGMNAPHLLEPWEIINSQNGGPYAVKTVLGWVVNGPLRCAAGIEGTVTVNRISVAGLEKLLISQYNQDFQEIASEEKTEMSVEDKAFLNMANEAVLENGHYSLKLPFRKPNVHMPSNRQMAEQRLCSLKRKWQGTKSSNRNTLHFSVNFWKTIMLKKSHRRSLCSHLERLGTCHTMGFTTLERKSSESCLTMLHHSKVCH